VRLPGTGAEAQAVGTEVLVRGDATEARVRAAVGAKPRWSAVHLACHGAMDLSQPLRSALALAPEAGDDGLLTAAEVYRLPVRSDVVVLSGCETARARVVDGEGSLGLVRAFFVAGAPRVVVALWKVDDAATNALMQVFHARWKAGAAAATALREAQAVVRAQARWAAPRYWAAWQLHGVW
jgi:CHAT domain-containing protein